MAVRKSLKANIPLLVEVQDYKGGARAFVIFQISLNSPSAVAFLRKIKDEPCFRPVAFGDSKHCRVESTSKSDMALPSITRPDRDPKKEYNFD